VTPILVRPVREQLEHDRVIRLLQLRWKRKYQVGINQGADQISPVTFGETVLYPDVVLARPGKAKKTEIVVEVETAESVNNLEALAEWVRLAQGKAEFHLYVPTGSVDAARRLCADHGIPVAEICSYHLVGEQMRFTTVFKAPPRSRPRPRPAAKQEAQAPARRPAPAAPSRRPSSSRPVRKAAGSPAKKKALVKPQRPAAKKKGSARSSSPKKRR